MVEAKYEKHPIERKERVQNRFSRWARYNKIVFGT
jgi:hypothetical protein